MKRAAATRGHLYATVPLGDHTPSRPHLAAVRTDDGGGETPGPRPRFAADGLAPRSVGGGLGYEADGEAATLAALALAVEVTARRSSGPAVRWALRDQLIGEWPWLHLADVRTGHSMGVLLVAGQAWAILGPHVAREARGPFRLTYDAADLAPLARRLVTGLGKGVPAGPFSGA